MLTLEITGIGSVWMPNPYGLLSASSHKQEIRVHHLLQFHSPSRLKLNEDAELTQLFQL